MKKLASLLMVSVLGGVITLSTYKLFIEQEAKDFDLNQQQDSAVFMPTSFSTASSLPMDTDFTEAAEMTVNGVVHVKNVRIAKRPRNMMEYLRGGGDSGRALAGAGSGVIISADGYIVTNNHVIEGANEIEVTLNDNRIFQAELVGTDPRADIALLKVDADNELPYIPFGDSDNAKIGEWVLAVGNPFNLTSTVTAGIISAKARDINEYDGNPQSFLQTDAAINPGNSGGALVNVNGELIGINTAITSQTGSYVGYAFAVPSNNARKIVEDILEFGNVQRGILGVSGQSLNPMLSENLEVEEIEGFYVGGVEYDSGAEKAGIKEGDIIKRIDNIRIRKFSDLSGYLGSKRPNDVVEVEIIRNGRPKTVPVTLVKLETFKLEEVGLEVKNASPRDLKPYGVKKGVVISGALSPDMQRYNLNGIVITEIDDNPVGDIDDVKRIIAQRNTNEPISITFVDRDGERNRFIFR
ncbi:trypsin-like peptidase domain-containing protein [Croceiramulus getboli]|nr:trypsin-like peptidase domain-containing protein [Flavobacteriaceae bacterium YJPT1-3]